MGTGLVVDMDMLMVMVMIMTRYGMNGMGGEGRDKVG